MSLMCMSTLPRCSCIYMGMAIRHTNSSWPAHRRKLYLHELPMDIVFEILSRLSVRDVVTIRQVCRNLWHAANQRSVWVKVYKSSNLLLPEWSLSSKRADLELSLVQAEKLHLNWTRSKPFPIRHRRFPRSLPAYDFEASVMSGRYLQIADKKGISWYDLDSTDLSTPVLTYPYPKTSLMNGALKYCSNAHSEGPYVYWVSFYSRSSRKVCILKVKLGDNEPSVELQSEIQTLNVASIQMDFEWLLLIREFGSSSDLMDMLHIPSQRIVHIPIHGKVQDSSDLCNMNYVITPQSLFIMFSTRSETHVDVYSLPKPSGPISLPTASHKYLVRSHSGIYPYAISTIQMFETSEGTPSGGSESRKPQTQTSLLGLVYLTHSPTRWTSKIGLHILDATWDLSSPLSFITRSQTTLDVGMVTTALLLSAQADTCLAVTHSSPGPTVLAHHIQRHRDMKYTHTVNTIELPKGMRSREILSFDGFRGRLCLITGWSNIDILDFV